MRTINRALLRRLLSAAALCLSGAALICALQIVLPARTLTLWLLTVLAKESSLLVTALALLGIVLAALVRRSGAPRVAIVAAALSTMAILLSLVPVVQARRTASIEGASLSPLEHFAIKGQSADRSPETIMYARPGGEELELDVWRPPGRGANVDGTQERPAVVLVHGGGWGSGTRSKTPRWDVWFAEGGTWSSI